MVLFERFIDDLENQYQNISFDSLAISPASINLDFKN